jgi:Flp pilus assembly protein TadG
MNRIENVIRTCRQHPVRPRTPRQLERGLSASTQFAAIFPALMLIMLGFIQAGIWLHARNTAAEAANAAADVARSYQGDPDAARRAAEHIARVGGLEELNVSVDRSDGTVQVTVSARAPTIFDVGLGQLRETATAPLERVTTP